MDWGSVIGGGLSAAGSIASGLLGKQGSGHSYQYYLDRQFNQTRDLAKNQPSWLVEGAKKAGLHPLAVLGMNVGSGQSFSMGDTGSSYQDTSWLNDAGQGIARAAGAWLIARLVLNRTNLIRSRCNRSWKTTICKTSCSVLKYANMALTMLWLP